MKRIAFAVGACVAALASAAFGQCDQWAPGQADPKLAFPTYSVCAWDPDGPGPLSECMTVVAALSSSASPDYGVRFWDGAAWRVVGSDFKTGTGRFSLRVVGGQLMALGDFYFIGDENIRFAARWDGTAWRQMGSMPPEITDDGVVIDGVLHVAGGSYVWKWLGTTWQRINVPLPGLRKLAVYDGKVVGTGLFTVPGAPDSTNIAVLEDGAWRPMGTGLDVQFDTFVEFEGSLVVGGMFTTAGGEFVQGVARWNGSGWSEMGQGFGTSGVRTLLVDDGVLIAGGGFSIAGRDLHGVARWNGSDWFPMSSGIAISGVPSRAGVFDLAVVNGEPVAAGSILMTYAGDYLLWNTAKWNGTEWRPIAEGYFGERLFEYGGEVIAPGSLGAYLGFPRHGLARWDGAAWSSFAVDPDWSLYYQGVFTQDGDDLIAAATGTAFSPQFVRRWDGESWSPVGEAVDGFIDALGVHNGQLIVAGNFTRIGSTPIVDIAAWDGSTWNAVGPAMQGAINAVESFGGKLIAGGAFVGPALMQWDGVQWTEVGARLTGDVTAMVKFDGGLIVAGAFARAGELTVNNIARWDGQSWSALGSAPGAGVNGRVYDLAVHGGELIAVGDFTTAGGGPASRIAVWNGGAWRALGSGLNDRAWSIAGMGDDLLITGRFTQAGGQVSTAFARWTGCAACPADLDGDGIVDFADYLVFLNLYEEGDLGADLNGDGIVDFADYLAFLTAFDGGCG